MNGQPICYDLYCGLGGWTEAFLEEGYRCIGFDVEAHDYGTGGYPGELRIRDVRSIHGRELRDAAVIVASPPCQKYSYMAMPWKRAKAQAAAIRADKTGEKLRELNELFNACFRIQREACEAAGRHIPMVVENVRGAQKWVGRASWNYGSFYLWGDVPALMPLTIKAQKFNPDGTQHPQGSWFAVADSRNRGTGRKVSMNFHEHAKTGKPGRSFQSAAVEEMGIKGIPHRTKGHWTNPAEHEGTKGGGDWFSSGDGCSVQRRQSSKSSARKLASAMIAKIPRPLALHIARAYKPVELEATA